MAKHELAAPIEPSEWYTQPITSLRRRVCVAGSAVIEQEEEYTNENGAVELCMVPVEAPWRAEILGESGIALGDKINGAKYGPQRIAEAFERRERERVEHGKRLAHLQRLCACLEPNIAAIKFHVTKRFEVSGVDVALTISASIQYSLEIEYDKTGAPHDHFFAYVWRNWQDSSCWQKKLNIEIKPTIGDDYPAVLRQMKANESDVLFIGTYAGKGAAREQFVKTFATADIRVVFVDEIER
jgi:hypothetical protein